MILISHRGNIDGKKPELENTPNYIQKALDLGYHVEIDIWYDNGFYLGHDFPQYEISFNYLINDKLWCHAKNIEAIIEMKKYPIHYFWHQEDDITLTSKEYIWAYPGKQPIKNSIAVMPELYNDDISKCIGICSDNIKKYKLK